MHHQPISANAFGFPMPVVLVGARVEGRANFMAVAWITRVNVKPPLLAVAINRRHHTIRGIEANGVFSVNVPGADLVAETDFCGIASGARADKSSLFEVFTGSSEAAPMIRDCPVCMSCRVRETVELEADNLYIAEIMEAWCAQECMRENKPDPEKIGAFALTMPDNRYWKLGPCIGNAWEIGRRQADSEE